MALHTFKAPNGCFAKCGVDVYRTAGSGTITVMLTERPDNPGPSVTNCVAELATDVVRGLMEVSIVVHPAAVRWIEHYQRAGHQGKPDWDEVLLDWDGRCYTTPRWLPVGGDRHAQPELGEAVKL